MLPEIRNPVSIASMQINALMQMPNNLRLTVWWELRDPIERMNWRGRVETMVYMSLAC